MRVSRQRAGTLRIMEFKKKGKVKLESFYSGSQLECSMCHRFSKLGLVRYARGTKDELVMCMDCELNLKWRNDTWPRIRLILSRRVPRGILPLINSFCYVSFEDVYKCEARFFRQWAADRYIFAAKSREWKRQKLKNESGGNIQSH